MPLEPAVTDLEQLKTHPALARLMERDAAAVEGAKFDRDEMTMVIARVFLREACSLLKLDLGFTFLADLTAVDWYPSEPRFEVVYHLLSMQHKERLRLKVKLAGDDAQVESVTGVWPAANFFEREVYDLFGIRFTGHPNLRRIMMPEDWEGHPLR